MAEVAELELRCVAHVHPRAIAIAPGLGGMDRDFSLQFELGGAA